MTTEHPHVERCQETGRHVVRGSRVPVTRLWAWHRKGVAVEVLVRRYPTLGWAKVLGALSWAHDNAEAVQAQLDLELERLRRNGAPP
jgi:uncharacterized protein (DUF433 family)